MITIILVKPRNPQNIGAAARAMSNFGFKDLRIVSPYAPMWGEVVSAVGAEDLLKKAVVFESLESALSDCNFALATTSLKNRRLRQKIVLLPEISKEIKGKTAIVFGPEKTGLTNEEIEQCNAILYIPVTAKTPSINLAQAVILCCYEISKGLNFTVARRAKKSNLAAIKDNEVLLAEAEKMLNSAAFKHALTPHAKRALFREILSQNTLTKEQVYMLKNLARKINERLG